MSNWQLIKVSNEKYVLRKYVVHPTLEHVCGMIAHPTHPDPLTYEEAKDALLPWAIFKVVEIYDGGDTSPSRYVIRNSFYYEKKYNKIAAHPIYTGYYSLKEARTILSDIGCISEACFQSLSDRTLADDN